MIRALLIIYILSISFINCQLWTSINATGSIPPPSSAYIAVRLSNIAVKYGGHIQGTGAGNITFFNTTHLFNLDTHVWTQISNPSPTGRSFAEAVAISETELIMYGGTTYTVPAVTVNVFDEFWKFDLSTETWTQIFFNGTRPVGGIFEHGMVFDPVNQDIYIWGGETPGLSIVGDMFNCSVITFNCEMVNQTGDVPVPRVGLVIRNLDDKNFIAAGGFSFTPRGAKPGLFIFNIKYQSWELQDFDIYNPLERGRYPTPRESQLFDIANDVLVVFGGDVDPADNVQSYYNLVSDTLSYNLKTKSGCGPIKKKEIWIFQDLNFHPPAMKRMKTVVYPPNPNPNAEIYEFGGILGGAFFGPTDVDTSDIFKYTPCSS